MALLPTDFGAPPTPYLFVLLAFGAATLAVLYRRRPPVTEATVAAFAPWMGTGGGLYALYQAGAVPPAVAPFFGSPAVYVTVGILAGLTWAAVADRPGEGWELRSAAGVLGLAGTGLLVATFAVALLVGLDRGGLFVGWPGASLLAAIVLTAIVWVVLARLDFDATGLVGVIAVFGHALDGTSTAVGYDVLGFAEQTPLSRFVLEFGAGLPGTAGGGWLFVLVKLLVAGAVVALFDDYVRESPVDGYLLLGFIAAVGLGPGVHNLVLFAIAGG